MPSMRVATRPHLVDAVTLAVTSHFTRETSAALRKKHPVRHSSFSRATPMADEAMADRIMEHGFSTRMPGSMPGGDTRGGVASTRGNTASGRGVSGDDGSGITDSGNGEEEEEGAALPSVTRVRTQAAARHTATATAIVLSYH